MANSTTTQHIFAWWAHANHLSAEKRAFFSRLLPKGWQQEKKTQYLDAVAEILSAPNAMVKPMADTRSAAIKLETEARRLAGALAALDSTDLFRLQPFLGELLFLPKHRGRLPHTKTAVSIDDFFDDAKDVCRALIALGEHAGERINPDRATKPSKVVARTLVRDLVSAHRRVIGQRPKGEWFHGFAQLVGESRGLRCGRDLVMSEISKLAG